MSLAGRLGLKALLIWDIFDPSPLGRYRRYSRPVDGWLTRNEEAALFRIARQVAPHQCIVELGSWFGRSAILLGGGSATGRGAPVFAVDLFQPAGCAKELLEQRTGDADRDFWNKFQQNIRSAGLDGRVTAIRSETAPLGDTWNGPPVGFLFIDADHSYEGVRRDWHSWKGRLAPGGRVAFHDYQNPAYAGVRRFVDELLQSGSLRSLEQHDSLLSGELAHAPSAG